MNRSKPLKEKRNKTRDEWLKLIKQCQTSSLSIEKFANQHGITKYALYYWSQQLSISLRNSKTEKPIEFIELQPLAPIPQTENTKWHALEIKVKDQFSIKTEAPWPYVVELIKGLS